MFQSRRDSLKVAQDVSPGWNWKSRLVPQGRLNPFRFTRPLSQNCAERRDPTQSPNGLGRNTPLKLKQGLMGTQAFPAGVRERSLGGGDQVVYLGPIFFHGAHAYARYGQQRGVASREAAGDIA
jgi:hypothetical protein